MGISGTLGAISAGGSLASGLAGLFGHSGAQAPPQWQMPGMSQAAGSALGGIGNLGQYNTYGQLLPQAMQTGQSLINNPYAGNYMTGGMNASQLGQLQALGQYGQGQNLINLGGNVLPGYAATVMGTGFDPQQQLYNQQYAQNVAQTQAQLAQTGTAMSPYGAGVAAGSNQNFDIAWQNAQLNRQLAALQGAGGALQTGGGLVGQGSQMQAAAPGQYLQASQMPYSVFGQIGGDQLNTLNALGQFGQSGSQIPQQQITDWLNYVGTGNQANQIANQNALTSAAIQNMYMGQIGSGMSGLGNAFGNLFGNKNTGNIPLLGSSPLGTGGIGHA
jgi:hypothetical protein